MQWVDDRGPDPIPDALLDRIMYLGAPTTAADGTHIPVAHDGPQAHLAIQGAATKELQTHFHGVEQFQFFVRGSGTVGRHPMSAGVVHYTDRYTVYGPLRPGPDGMAYATLRVRHDPGASFMPEARHRLAELLATSARSAQDRRNVTIDLRTSPDEAGGDTTSEWLDLLTGADGLRVAVHQGIGGSSMAPVLVGGAGAYIAVVDGALDDAGTPRGPGAIAWQDPGTSFHAVATDSGARVALLQFPVVRVVAA